MKEIIQEALKEANKLLIEQFPTNKTVEKSVLITGMTLTQAVAYCPEAPVTAYLTSGDDGGEVYIEWSEKVPVTGDDIAKFKQRLFPSIAWQCVYNALTAAGYKRVGFSSSLLESFDGVSLYDKFLDQDFDFFAYYYSFRFTKSGVK